MGRRKWKLYQDALIPRRDDDQSSDEDSMPATDQPPALKIKTIEQINEDERKVKSVSCQSSLIGTWTPCPPMTSPLRSS